MLQIKTKLTAAAYSMGGVNWPKLFLFYDRNVSGDIGMPEFRNLIRKDAKVTPEMLSDEMLDHMFWVVDEDKSGQVAYREFLLWLEHDVGVDVEHELEQDALDLAAPDTPRNAAPADEPDPAAADSRSLAELAARSPSADKELDPAASLIQRKVRARLERQSTSLRDKMPEGSAAALADGERKPPAAAAAVQESTHRVSAIEAEMDGHLEAFKAETAAIEATWSSATAIQRHVRGRQSRRSTRQLTASQAVVHAALAKASEQETPAAAALVDVQELRAHARDLFANAGNGGSLLEMLAAVKQELVCATEGTDCQDGPAEDPGSPSAAEAVAVLQAELNRTKPQSPVPNSLPQERMPVLPGKGRQSQGPGRPPAGRQGADRPAGRQSQGAVSAKGKSTSAGSPKP